MKKVIAVLDGSTYSESTVTYAIQMAKLMNAYLVGVFVDDLACYSHEKHEFIGNDGVGIAYDILIKSDFEVQNLPVIFFEDACRAATVNYSIHHDRNIDLRELIQETEYADLLVIGCHEIFTQYEAKQLDRFMHKVLAQAACPVLLVPETFSYITKIVLLYDGDPVSVYAIKMFSYLLSGLKDLKTEVISMKNNKLSLHVPDSQLIKEFMKGHYPRALFTLLKGSTETEIINYMADENAHTVIVVGADQHGLIARWFGQKLVNGLLRELNMPLFIAHSR